MAKVIFMVVVLLCILLRPQHSYGAGEEGYLKANSDVQNLHNRKVLNDREIKKLVLKEVVRGQKKKEVKLGGELREAPMGPDPLHHNGAPPKKPRATP